MDLAKASDDGSDISNKHKELLNLSKNGSFSFDSRLLATIESTRTVLGIIQSPVSLSKSKSISLNSTLKKGNRILVKTYSSPFTDEIYKVQEEKSYSAEIQNINPDSLGQETTATDEYDTEHTLRIQCERKIERLQELTLCVEQENAVLKLNNHKKEKEIRTLTETLNKIKENWKNTEDYVSTVTEHHSKLQEEFEKEQNLNSALAKEMSILIKDNEILREKHKHTENIYKIQVDSLSAELENLKGQMAAQSQYISQCKKDIQIYQNDLFTMEKEKQDLSRSKLKIETDYEEKLCDIKTKFSEILRLNEDLKTLKEKTATELRMLKADNESLTQKIKDILNEKDSLEVEFRKSEAHKVVQEVENCATLKKILSEKEKEFEEYEKQFSLLRADEVEKMKCQYKSLIENLSSQHRIQVEELLRVQDETNRINENSLKKAEEEIVNLRTKIGKLESGRNRILSKLQVHLQKQWRESVQLLYEDEDQSDIPPETFETSLKSKWLQSNNVLFNSPSPLRLNVTEEMLNTSKMSTNTASIDTQQMPLVSIERLSPEKPICDAQGSFSTPQTTCQINEYASSNSQKLQHYIKRLLQEKSRSWPHLASPTFDKSEICHANTTEKV